MADAALPANESGVQNTLYKEYTDYYCHLNGKDGTEYVKPFINCDGHLSRELIKSVDLTQHLMLNVVDGATISRRIDDGWEKYNTHLVWEIGDGVYSNIEFTTPLSHLKKIPQMKLVDVINIILLNSPWLTKEFSVEVPDLLSASFVHKRGAWKIEIPRFLDNCSLYLEGESFAVWLTLVLEAVIAA